MRMRRFRRRRRDLTPQQEKLEAQRDINEMRASILSTGAALALTKYSDNLTQFDRLRDFINTDLAEAVTAASAADKAYNDSFCRPPRAQKAQPKQKRAAKR
jgi:hypothetical protein